MHATARDTIVQDTTTTRIDLGTVRFLIESDDSSITDVLTRLFPQSHAYADAEPRLEPPEHHYRIRRFMSERGQDRFSVESDGEMQRESLELRWTIAVTASLISDQVMQAYGDCYRTLHAGAFAKGDCGILVPGESHSGKSTTSAMFALAGFRFYTDDVAAFDEDLRLIPHPRAIMLRTGGWNHLRKAFPERAEDRLVWGDAATETWYVDAFGPSACADGTEHPKIKLILLPTRVPGAPTLTPITRSEVVPLLVSQCFGMTSDPAGSLTMIVRLASGADSYTINMHDPQKAIDAVNQLIEA